MVAVIREGGAQREIDRLPGCEGLGHDLRLAVAAGGVQIAPDSARRDGQSRRVVFAQERGQLRLHDDPGPTGGHGPGIALEYLDIRADAPQGNPGAEPSDRAAGNRHLQGRFPTHDAPTASSICASISSARCAPEKAGRPLMTNVGTPFMPPRFEAASASATSSAPSVPARKTLARARSIPAAAAKSA